MNFSHVSRTGLALTGLCLLTVGGQAQQADPPQNGAAAQADSETVHETNRQYARSILIRSHQAGEKDKMSRTDYTMDVDAGNTGAVSFVIHEFRANHKRRIELTPVGQGVGEVGTKLKQLHFLTVSDGQTEFSYNNNIYTRKPATPNESGVTEGTFSFVGDLSAVSCELLPPITLNGHPVFVIRVKPDAQDTIGHITAFIDQDTYRLRKMDMSFGDTPDATLHFMLTVTNNVINPTMPANLFKFTPPKGAKEAKAAPEAGVTIFQTAMAGFMAQNAAKTK